MTEKSKSGVYDRLLYWSAESRLDSAHHEGDMVRYDYNALGKPVIKYRRGTTSSWYAYSYYIWDGDQLLIELDLNKKRNADFVYYPGTIDQPIAHGIGDSTVTAIRDFRSDAEGNTLATVVDGDYIQSQDTYDAWGTPAHDGQLNSALFWKGLKWEGDAVNLYFVRNRWYDPELGRFASEDPIGHAGGENLYTYANNEPINGSDAAGLMQESCTTQWVEFGTNGGTETHAYSFLACRSVGGGGGVPTLAGFGNQSDPGSGGGGAPPTIGPTLHVSQPANIPKWRTPACFVSAGLLAVSGLTDVAYVAGVGLAARAGASVLTAIGGVALQDALEFETGVGLNRSIMLASGAQARNLAFGATAAAFQSRDYSFKDFLIDMVPFVRTKARYSEARAACHQ